MIKFLNKITDMATLKEANKAREEHSNYLHELGAHAVAVEKVKEKGTDTFGVIAYCETLPEEPPETLEIEYKGKRKEIPLKVEISPMAELE